MGFLNTFQYKKTGDDAIDKAFASVSQQFQRIASMKSPPFINVKDYGAKGYPADDTATIQNALDVGGQIYFPEPNYKISEPMVLSPGLHILGNSHIGTIFTIDHSVKAHAPAFIWDTTADLYNWSIKNVKIDFSACGQPSNHAEDIGIKLAASGTGKTTYLYEISDVRIGNAYWAFWDESAGFHGKLDRFWSNMSRNGIHKKNGTQMVLENVEIGGRKDGTDGCAYYFENISGLTMSVCVAETWKNNDMAHFKDLREFNATTLHFEDASTLTAGAGDKRLIILDHCNGANIKGLLFWACDVVPYNNANAELVYVLHGRGNIDGVQIEGAGASNKCSGGNAGSHVHTVAFNDSAKWAISGCDLKELESSGGYPGTKHALKNYSDTSYIVVIASDIESTSDDYAQIKVV